MEALLILIALYLLFAVVAFPIWMLIRTGSTNDIVAQLRRRIERLEDEVAQLRAPRTPEVGAGLSRAISEHEAPPTPVAPVTPEPAPAAPLPVEAVVAPEPPPLPPYLEPAAEPNTEPIRDAAYRVPEPAAVAAPAASAPLADDPAPSYAPKPGWTSAINWEQFMGAKLFAWLGGLALFLGVAFFVKYSFDHGWIPAEVRAAMGFVFALGLVVGGLKIDRARFAVTAQTLIATGIVSLYAVTFACRSIYHFEFFGVIPTFLLMVLITATAFVLAVRLEAQVIAILGMLGGFLTPLLLSTGVDNPGGLFGYLALLDLGLVAVALHRRWFHLIPLGAIGTVILMIGWAEKFYAPEKTGTAMTICLAFCALFFAARESARRLQREHSFLNWTAAALPVIAFGFAWLFAGHGDAAAGPGALFGFVFLTGAFWFAQAWRDQREWLIAAAAGATGILIIRWAAESFAPEHAGVLVAVTLSFSALYFVTYLIARRFQRAGAEILWSAIGLPALCLGFAVMLMQYATLGARVGLLFGYILAADLLLLAIAWLDEEVPKLHLAAGFAVFGLLSLWTGQHLTEALLPWALASYLGFAALHSVFPLVLERHRPAASPTWWSQLFPPLTLVLMLFPLLRLETTSFLLWPAILLVDLLAVVLAVLSASLAAVAAVLVLTLLATGVCIFKVPAIVDLPASLLVAIGFFALFFFGVSLWLVRKLGARLPAAAGGALHGVFGDARAQLPAFASLLPFLLLIMASGRLSIPDPSAIFGLGLLLVVLTLGLTRLLLIEWLPACALAGMAALLYVWHGRHFNPAEAGLPLVWYVTSYLAFAAYPFLFRRQFASQTGPWCIAALSGVAHFGVIYRAIQLGWPGMAGMLGAIPALFVAAPLTGVFGVLRGTPAASPARLNQLAWFGGVALLFITLIFPIQFERQWLTVAWALEGAALLWLFHRVPHPGLRGTGAVLLVVAFVRLALNPAVLGYHERGGAILNWYFYAYGLTVAALFVGARLTAPRESAFRVPLPPLFHTLGTVLAFLLLNLEIADFFTVPGARTLTFQFSGNFARDMSYTIGWALFALGLLAAGLWKHLKAARYAAIALLSVALLKLFFHDLARLEALYRIGALFAVAVIAIVASFAYQRFLPGNEKSVPPAR